MDKIVITGLSPHYDGEHPFDISYFTMDELHTIKRLSGVRAGELEDSLNAGDSDVMLAIAVIALQRNNVAVNERQLWDAKMGAIRLELGDTTAEEAVDGGEAVAPEPTSSGADSPLSSGGHRVTGQSPTGTVVSVTGATSEFETSGV